MSRFALFFLAFSGFGADIAGIWAGQQQGTRGEPEDVAFRFKMDGQKLTGTLFGDEFDIPIGDASLKGEEIRFSITATNYYRGTKTVYVYSGTVKLGSMELVRERLATDEDKAANRQIPKQTLKLKKM